MSTLMVAGSMPAHSGMGILVLSAYGSGLVSCPSAPGANATATMAAEVSAITTRRRCSISSSLEGETRAPCQSRVAADAIAGKTRICRPGLNLLRPTIRGPATWYQPRSISPRGAVVGSSKQNLNTVLYGASLVRVVSGGDCHASVGGPARSDKGAAPHWCRRLAGSPTRGARAPGRSVMAGTTAGCVDIQRCFPWSAQESTVAGLCRGVAVDACRLLLLSCTRT